MLSVARCSSARRAGHRDFAADFAALRSRRVSRHWRSDFAIVHRAQGRLVPYPAALCTWLCCVQSNGGLGRRGRRAPHLPAQRARRGARRRRRPRHRGPAGAARRGRGGAAAGRRRGDGGGLARGGRLLALRAGGRLPRALRGALLLRAAAGAAAPLRQRRDGDRAVGRGVRAALAGGARQLQARAPAAPRAHLPGHTSPRGAPVEGVRGVARRPDARRLRARRRHLRRLGAPRPHRRGVRGRDHPRGRLGPRRPPLPPRRPHRAGVEEVAAAEPDRLHLRRGAVDDQRVRGARLPAAQRDGAARPRGPPRPHPPRRLARRGADPDVRRALRDDEAAVAREAPRSGRRRHQPLPAALLTLELVDAQLRVVAAHVDAARRAQLLPHAAPRGEELPPPAAVLALARPQHRRPRPRRRGERD